MTSMTKTSWIAVASILIVLLALAVGVLYLKDMLPGMNKQEEAVRALETLSDSTEPEAIEADLSAESPDEFDKEFDAAFAELDASLAQ